MSDATKNAAAGQNEAEKKDTAEKPARESDGPAKAGQSGRGNPRDKGQRKPKRGKKKPETKEDEYEQRIIDIARVTRVMAGGKRMRFRACVAVGNRSGKIGIGLAKGADVSIAVSKAVTKAKKDMVNVPMVNETLPHEIYQKFGAAKIIFKPSRKGRGVIAGGAVRIVLELAGVKNVTSKILGTNNKINNVKCTIEALRSLKMGAKKEEAIEVPAKEAAPAVKEESKE